MKLQLSKNEKDYLGFHPYSSYLLIKQPRFGSIDKFVVCDENKEKLYSIKIKRGFGKTSKTIIVDKSGKVVGKMKWNNSATLISSYNACIFGLDFEINYETEASGIWFLRNSYYVAKNYAWVMDDKVIKDANDAMCAEIHTINNYGKKRNSYLINRLYNPQYKDGDVLSLLFWTIDYIHNDYEENHRNTAAGRINSFLIDREKDICDKEVEKKRELEDTAKSYISDKEYKYSEDYQALSSKQIILRRILKVLICLVAPILGAYVIAIIPYSIVPYNFNLISVMVFFFIVSILGVNYRTPERVLFYEWVGLIAFLFIGFSLGAIIGKFIEKRLQIAGIQGIRIAIPLCTLILCSVFKWKSRYIAALVKMRPLFTAMQSVAVGLFVGSLLIVLVDQTGRLAIIVGGSVFLVVLLFSKAKIIAKTTIRCVIGGCSLGVLIEGLIKIML